MNSEEKELLESKINVFLSVPMANKTKQQIEDELTTHIYKVNDYVKRNYNKDAHLIDSFIEDWGKYTPIECLGKSIEMLSQADLVVMYPDWEKTRGCRIEHEVAVLYNKPILYLNK